LKIAILGTRGIPNSYSGIEEFAEHLSFGLVQKGHEVTVYKASDHPYKNDRYKGAKLSTHYNPEKYIGASGQFIYDLLCILDTRKNNFDIILQVGYTSSSVWSWLLPRGKSMIVSNMDGFEWKRAKWNFLIKKFLRVAEKWAVSGSHFLVSDSKAIRDYIMKTYLKDSTYIPYGAYKITQTPSPDILTSFNLVPYNYNLMIARLEPENNIEMIIEGTINANDPNNKFVITGSTATKFGRIINKKYGNHPLIIFTDGIFDREKLSALRYYSNFYFHGHCVGGTNPSLLEAMGGYCLIYAHDNEFNKLILGDNGGYFSSSKDVSDILLSQPRKTLDQPFLKKNFLLIDTTYSWDNVSEAYSKMFSEIVNGSNPKPSYFTSH
jgi:glycosyltransferase involved in cell wall biosynthesis